MSACSHCPSSDVAVCRQTQRRGPAPGPPLWQGRWHGPAAWPHPLPPAAGFPGRILKHLGGGGQRLPDLSGAGTRRPLSGPSRRQAVRPRRTRKADCLVRKTVPFPAGIPSRLPCALSAPAPGLSDRFRCPVPPGVWGPVRREPARSWERSRKRNSVTFAGVWEPLFLPVSRPHPSCCL